jgi:hypothetical protein
VTAGANWPLPLPSDDVTHWSGKPPGEVRCINCLSSPLRGFSLVRYRTDIQRNIGAFFGTSIPLRCSFAMQLFSYNFTDLTTFDSPQKEIWLDEKDLPDFGKRTAREMLAAVPDLQHKGLCVGIYDEAGEPISYVPLDTLQ